MKKIIFIAVFSILVVGSINAQEKDYGPLNTGVANFLNITTDARSAAMGGAGLTLPAGGNSVFHNGAALFLQDESKTGISYTYTPWMREYKSGYSLNAIGGFYKINKKHAVLAGFRYYNYPKTELSSGSQEDFRTLHPGELALDLGYSYEIKHNLAISATLRYIRSDLGNLNGAKVGDAVAFDIGGVYQREINAIKAASWAVGFQLVNIGTKIKYLETKESIPAAVKLGGSVNLPFSDVHKLMIATDLGYRLSPSDMHTLGVSAGAEYTFINHFMLRGGYHYGEEEKADFSYATAGAGIQYFGAQVDFSWLFAGSDNPWRNTFRISLGFSF